MLGRAQLWTPPQLAAVRFCCRSVPACVRAPRAVSGAASCPRRLHVSRAHHRRQLPLGLRTARATPEAAETQPAEAMPGAPAASASLSDAEWAQANGYSADGLGVVALDANLEAHKPHLQYRWQKFLKRRRELENAEGGLHQFSLGFHNFGFNRHNGAIFYREWAPAATGASLIGDFNSWNPTSHPMERDTWGVWTVRLPDLPDGSPAIPHGSKVKVQLRTRDGGCVDRIPAWIRYASAEPGRMGATYDGIYWDPPAPYEWQHASPPAPRALRIYEAHVGMSGTEPRCATYREFADAVLPRIAAGGYNTVQLMAIQEHSYYASFGYHVTNFFAVSSRSGSPEDLKYLVDTAHGLGLRVLLDIVHSHASSNKADGLNGYDFGQDSGDSYFHSGERGYHRLWDSRCFRYDNWEVQRYLLSNLHFWLAEYRFDGFRFDGVTSMLYIHHGIARGFSGQYGEYFGYDTDVDAVVYLMLANDLIKRVNPEATVLAEDVSGMPTLCRPVAEGGVGFDARLAMAVPDHWIKLLKERPDPQWGMHELVTVLCNRRYTERAVAYAESHDQALVGDKTIAFWLMDKHMYDGMSTLQPASDAVRRGMALHKVIRAVTCVLGGEGYLNFMGNEFGHPEWIDFPREGNGWSHHHCRRRWDLADAEHLRYSQLQAFDGALMALEETFKWLSHPHQLVSVANDGDKLIVAERGDLLWVFNFSPTDYTGYAVPGPKPGAYTRVFDTEEPRFGGHGAASAGAGAASPPVVASPGGPDTWVGPYKQDKRAATLLLDIPRRSAQAYVWCGELPATGTA